VNGGAATHALRLAVVGDPVAHSASPGLMRAFLADAGIAGSYEAIRVPRGSGAAAIDDLRARGFHGLNVTTPLKEEAFARAERRDAGASAAGSLNTLVLGERIDGYNTDGIGAARALCEAGLATLAARCVLVLGAGPTARSACSAFVACGATVWVSNRTAARVDELVRTFGVRPFEARARYDAVFAALPPGATIDDASVRGAILATPVFVDANYGPRATLAASLGRGGADGLAMLRHGAAAAFAIWLRAWRPAATLGADGGEGEIRTPETF